MQSILFLRPSEDKEPDRIINIDLLSSASIHPENPEWTRAFVGNCEITMHMTFAQFTEKVQALIAENYRVSNESYVMWHNKRMADQEEMMKSVLGELHK